MRLANIPFTNTAPFFGRLDPAWLAEQDVVSDSPRDLGRLAREGRVDAGVFSLVDLWDLQKRGAFEPLGELGIAGRGPIRSILLFGTNDPTRLEGARIAVSGQTSTSVRLMDLWLRRAVGIRTWTPVALGEPSDAALLIGDQALARGLSLGREEPRPIDLCERWTAWTGLPFVFARWGVSRTLSGPERQALLERVEGSLTAWEADPAPLAAEQAAATGFPAPFLEAYLRGIIYRLGESERRGMDHFHQLLEEA